MKNQYDTDMQVNILTIIGRTSSTMTGLVREAPEKGPTTFVYALVPGQLFRNRVYTNCLDKGIYAGVGIYHAEAVAHAQGGRRRLGAVEGARRAGWFKSFGVDTGTVQWGSGHESGHATESRSTCGKTAGWLC